MNKAIIIGNLGGDPELAYTPQQVPVCKFSVATTERFKDKEETTWHKVVVWQKTAENCAKYLAKGSKVCVEGRITHRSFEGRNGEKVHITEIVASHVEFLSRSNKEQDGGARGDSYEGPNNDSW